MYRVFVNFDISVGHIAVILGIIIFVRATPKYYEANAEWND